MLRQSKLSSKHECTTAWSHTLRVAPDCSWAIPGDFWLSRLHSRVHAAAKSGHRVSAQALLDALIAEDAPHCFATDAPTWGNVFLAWYQRQVALISQDLHLYRKFPTILGE